MRASSLSSLISLLALVAGVGCGATSSLPRRDLSTGGGEELDLSVPAQIEDLGDPDPVNCDPNTRCKTGKRCYQGMCIPDNGGCQSDNDCQNDTWCDCTGGGGGDAGPCVDGVCVPYGTGARGAFDPMCRTEGFAPSAFKAPVEKCHWKPTKGEAGDVIMTPIVVDLDGDGQPEIVFVNFDSGGLIALHGKDCSPYFELPGLGLLQFSQIAAADLDKDKKPEIIAVDGAQRVTVFDNKGTQLAKSPMAYQGGNQGSDCVAPAIADVDKDGIPEILVSGQVLRYRKGQAALDVLWTKPPSSGAPAHWGTLSVFADLDGDGKPEAITGLKVYDGLTGADKTPAVIGQLGATGAYPQVADFNGDGKPDILLVQSQPNMQQVSIVDFTNNKIIFGPYLVNNGWGGPAVVADFDGDKIPDFGLASTNRYYVYSMKCAKQQKPADCKGVNPGVLWERNTYDSSSGGTGSSVFDFNGDGKAEVVYRDECWLRVMNGPDGKTVFAQQITSGTCLEMPIVADVDNDGHADIVVPSDNVQGNNHCAAVPEGQTGQTFVGSTEGMFVFTDPMNRWIKSRTIWNEHSYHITNVLDDSSVPMVETPNWTQFNNYRQNVQGLVGMPMDFPDFTGGPGAGVDPGQADCSIKWTLRASICNRGTATVQPGVQGTFYQSDPRQNGAKKICTGATSKPIGPGECDVVQCDWPMPPQTPMNLWFRADDDGSGAKLLPECKEGNDLLFLPDAACMKIG